jgi:hypothetical protein
MIEPKSQQEPLLPPFVSVISTVIAVLVPSQPEFVIVELVTLSVPPWWLINHWEAVVELIS